MQVKGKLRAQVAEILQYVFRIPSAYIHKKYRLSFYGPSQNCEKRLLASSCLSILLSLRMGHLGFQLGAFSWTCILGTSLKICREILSLSKIGQNIRHWREELSAFVISRWYFLVCERSDKKEETIKTSNQLTSILVHIGENKWTSGFWLCMKHGLR